MFYMYVRLCCTFSFGVGLLIHRNASSLHRSSASTAAAIFLADVVSRSHLGPFDRKAAYEPRFRRPINAINATIT